ncbi:fatty-acyl-CoA synthase [Burkholderiales bacterium]|nr:fatty-acyl-CoA synthase [Burkholderiales bacterium]
MSSVQRIADVVDRGAARFADRPALRDGDRVLTYLDLARSVEASSAGLAALGVRAGDRVIVVTENGAEAIVLLFAVGRLDAWPLLAAARLGAREIDAIAVLCEPRLALYLSARSEAAAGHAARRGASAVELAPLGTMHVERPPGDPEPEPPPARPGDGVAAMICTSGTTGAPKAAMLTHANILFIAQAQRRLRRYGPHDRVYLPMPIAYAGALASITMSTLVAGGCVHLAQRFAPEELARALREDGVTVVPGVPALHARFAAWVREHPDAFSAPRARMVTSASSPLDATVKAAIESLYGLPLQNGYGLTETSAVVCQTRLDDRRSDTSVGRPLPDVRVRIVDADGCDAVPGETGEIQVRGPNVFPGYYRNPDETRAAFTPEGWFRTGDLGRVDRAGDLHIAGRFKDLIKHSGYTVYPADVEAALNAHPAVATCAVVGRPHGADEQIVAFAQLEDGASVTPADLAAFLAGRIADHKQPGLLRIVPHLPTLANGKADRMSLRKVALGLPAQ